LRKRCVQKRFAYFGLFFLLIKNIYPAHTPAATSRYGLIDWNRHVYVWTQNTVRGQSA
jgi:hypothetical protein